MEILTICPKDGRKLFTFLEEENVGRVWCVCGFSKYYFKQIPETTKERCAEIWGVDKRFYGNNRRGPNKHLRTYTCIVCQKTVTREVYSRENTCGENKCFYKRQLLYSFRSYRKRGLKLNSGRLFDAMNNFGQEAV